MGIGKWTRTKPKEHVRRFKNDTRGNGGDRPILSPECWRIVIYVVLCALLIGGWLFYRVLVGDLVPMAVAMESPDEGMNLINHGEPVISTQIHLFHGGSGSAHQVEDGGGHPGCLVSNEGSRKLVELKRFRQEMAAVAVEGCLKHENVVQLVGWCCEGDELVLVYHFMPHPSLDRFASFLYLNLYERKFSCSARTVTIPAGTMGYVAPEYVQTGVYSFGVVVFEVATGRRPVEIDGCILVDQVGGKWSKAKFREGASGLVYEGSLASGKQVAIKRFSLASQVEGCLKHRPWCCERDELVLLYGFMPNGSLHRFPHFNMATNRTSSHLNCKRTRNVVLGLLDHQLCQMFETIQKMHLQVGKNNATKLFQSSAKVREMWSKGKLMEVVDSRLLGRFEMRDMERMLMVGLACVHPDCKKRPEMKEAERILRGDAPNPILPEIIIQPVPQDVLLMQGDRNGSSDTLPLGSPCPHFS